MTNKRWLQSIKKWGEFSPGLTLSPSNKKYLTKAHYPLEERN